MTRLKKEVLEIQKADYYFGVASRSENDKKVIKVYKELKWN